SLEQLECDATLLPNHSLLPTNKTTKRYFHDKKFGAISETNTSGNGQVAKEKLGKLLKEIKDMHLTISRLMIISKRIKARIRGQKNYPKKKTSLHTGLVELTNKE
ncbi:hypothetical protein LOAG_13242, partial [Loa loa]